MIFFISAEGEKIINSNIYNSLGKRHGSRKGRISRC